MSQHTAERTELVGHDTFVPVEIVRQLVGRGGRPLSREKVFTLGLERELDIKRVAGRFVASRESVEAYRARHGIA